MATRTFGIGPHDLPNNSGSLAIFAAMRRAASAGINKAVLSQKRLERLTVAFRYGSTQRYCLIFWLIRLNKIRCPVLHR